MKTYKLVIITINTPAFQATGHVLPASYIINLSKEQLDKINTLEKRGETLDRVYISEAEDENT